MIIGKINNTEKAESMHPLFKKLFDFVRNHDFSNLPTGRIEIEGDDLYIVNNKIDGCCKESQPLELHHRYIDVHILLDGIEEIGWKPTEELAALKKEYDESGDYALSDDNPRFYVKLTPGEYCIVYPEDAHSPAISNGRLHKLIGKVKI